MIKEKYWVLNVLDSTVILASLDEQDGQIRIGLR
jgi:hypothetical protein